MSATQAVQQSILNKNRKDKFILVLTLPNALKEVNKSSLGDRSTQTLNQDTLQYSIYGGIVPNIAIPEVDVSFSGQTGKVTSYNRPAYSSVTVNFTVDNGYNNWWVLWYWLNLINNSSQGYYNSNNIPLGNTFKNKNSYMTDMTVYGLDEYNNKVIQFDYTQAFITGLGEIGFNYRDPEQIESSFTFVFSQLNVQLL